MKRYQPESSPCVSLLSRMQMRVLLVLLALTVAGQAAAQRHFPDSTGQRARYGVYIEMPRGYVSGVCMLNNDGDVVRGSIFNEFGVTALDFTYHLQKEKVKLHSVMGLMDKWYIRRVLRKDLHEVMAGLQRGDTAYDDTRHHITYRFTPMNHSEQEDK